MNAIVKEEEVRGTGKRRVLYGWLCTFEDGSKAYFERKKHKDINRGGESTISDAMTAGVAGWSIDANRLISMRARGATMIGVRVTDTKDVYLTTLKAFYDRKTSRQRIYDGDRKGAEQRVCLLTAFKKREGVIRIAGFGRNKPEE